MRNFCNLQQTTTRANKKVKQLSIQNSIIIATFTLSYALRYNYNTHKKRTLEKLYVKTATTSKYVTISQLHVTCLVYLYHFQDKDNFLLSENYTYIKQIKNHVMRINS